MTGKEFYKNQIQEISYKKSCLNGVKGVEDACYEPIYSKDELIAFAEAYYQAKIKDIMPSDEEIKKWSNDDISETVKKANYGAYYDVGLNARIKGAMWLKQQLNK